MPSTFDKSLTLFLQSYLTDQQPLLINWKCVHCRENHQKNLLNDVQTIANDFNSGDLKADIGLLNSNQELIATVHISKNIKPISTNITYYQAHHIKYIQVRPGNDILGSIETPLYVGACLNPQCEKCGRHQHQKNMLVIDSKCWKCNGDMKLAVLECSGYSGGPDRITEMNLRSPKVKVRTSKTISVKLLVKVINPIPAHGAIISAETIS